VARVSSPRLAARLVLVGLGEPGHAVAQAEQGRVLGGRPVEGLDAGCRHARPVLGAGHRDAEVGKEHDDAAGRVGAALREPDLVAAALGGAVQGASGVDVRRGVEHGGGSGGSGGGRAAGVADRRGLRKAGA
jgi:hypothetical protein